MKNAIKKIIYNLNYKKLLRNTILMESNPDYMDNTRAVCDELVKRGINNKYKIIWLVTNKSLFKDYKIKNVYFCDRNKKIRTIIHIMFCKCIIECNTYIRKLNKHQYRIYLQHGLPVKHAKKYASLIGNVDDIISSSDFFVKTLSDLYKISQKNVIITGFPRNDWLFDDKNKLVLYPEINRDKTIIWLPTFRNHKCANTDFKTFTYGIPFFNDKNDLIRINELLMERNILLLIKLHPAEDTSKFLSFNLSNIKLVDDKVFFEKDSNLHKLLSATDAMITDYSSVYFDYLLLDKPIGLAIPDINYYKENNGFVYDDYYDVLRGDYLYKIEDLESFIINVSNNNDSKLNERKKLKRIYNKYLDDNSSKRVVDYIMTKIEGDK